MSVDVEPPRKSDRAKDYLSRGDALRVLGIKPQTLYAYVSRGLIRRVVQANGRRSYYLREDVDRVKARSIARSGHGPAAASAVRWGEPVIVTSLTEITEAGPRYRDRLAADLARSEAPLEAVAEYLWTGGWPDAPAPWRVEPPPAELLSLLAATHRLHPDIHILQLLAQAALSLGIAEGGRADQEIEAAVTDPMRRLILTMAGVFGFLGPRQACVSMEEGEPVVRGLARALGLAPDPLHLRALNAALVLVADHEFNPATFAARIAASGGADLHACIGAALAVHFGSEIGLRCDEIGRLFSSLEPGEIMAKVEASLGAGKTLPGFNHPLYPHGDPRAAMLIDLARRAGRPGPAADGLPGVIEEMRRRFDVLPTIETGLVVLCRTLGLPEQAASGLFALARSVGWAAHIIEQRRANFMIRPRAMFTPPA